MAPLKTQKTAASVSAFIAGIDDEDRRKDCKALVTLFKEVTQAPPRMWGPAIVGFGDLQYQRGKEKYDWFLTGFSPRKQALTLYLMGGHKEHPELMAKLGKYTTAGGCLYIKRLSDVHVPTLKTVIKLELKRIRSNPRFTT